MDIFRGIYGFFNRSDDLDFNSKRQGSSGELNLDNECIDGSSNHASSAPLSVEEVDDSFESSPPQLAKTRREMNAVVANFFVVFFMMSLP
jgi:hypothetical protein